MHANNALLCWSRMRFYLTKRILVFEEVHPFMVKKRISQNALFIAKLGVVFMPFGIPFCLLVKALL